jgi:hypothetical protein
MAERPSSVARWIVPVLVVGGWLVLITSRQAALYPPAPTPARELLPTTLVGGLVAVAAVARVARPGLLTHVAVLGALTCGMALVAAMLGQPLASATVDQCGDFCRTAIIGRFIAFFAWPLVAAAILVLVARAERRSAAVGSAERVAWTRAWAVVTIVLAMAAAIVWWRIILPEG